LSKEQLIINFKEELSQRNRLMNGDDSNGSELEYLRCLLKDPLISETDVIHIRNEIINLEDCREDLNNSKNSNDNNDNDSTFGSDCSNFGTDKSHFGSEKSHFGSDNHDVNPEIFMNDSERRPDEDYSMNREPSTISLSKLLANFHRRADIGMYIYMYIYIYIYIYIYPLELIPTAN
jgi:hypothetical protein